MLSLLVTGSDTGVGKTRVVGSLARHFLSQGLSVQIVKPVETGLSVSVAPDAEEAKRYAKLVNKEGRIKSFTLASFLTPLAPFSAAKLENKELSLKSLINAALLLPKCDVRIYEGAGGIASPLTTQADTITDFGEALGINLIVVVVSDQLGAINQAKLSYDKALQTGIPSGVWLNAIAAIDAQLALSNRHGLLIYEIPLWGELGFQVTEAILSPDFRSLLQEKPSEVKEKETSFENRLKVVLIERESKKLTRFLTLAPKTSTLLNLSDNDYLNLSNDPSLISAGQKALEKYGTSASASPLITGWTKAHEILVSDLVKWHGMAYGLIWSSGFAANAAILSTLPKEGDLVFADKLIHHSMIAGLKRSGAHVRRYPHLDLAVLENWLKAAAASDPLKTIFVVTESVYSMDGDYPDLLLLAELKKLYPFIWILDEAHALGWYGKNGAGLASHYGVTDCVDILVGTLGKTLASGGAYSLFNSVTYRDYLTNFAGEFIYSTALPPSNAAVASAAISQVSTFSLEQNNWHALSSDFRKRLIENGWETLPGESPIIPVRLNNEASALELSQYLKDHGILAFAIRPPTVPSGTSRLRFSLKRGVTAHDLEKVLQIMNQWRNKA